MKFAVNYSPQVAGLYQAGIVPLDAFKCPPWPDTVAQAQAVAPVTIHFPFSVGTGEGDARDNHSGETPDWVQVERWLQETETHFINLHLTPRCQDHPHIPHDSLLPDHVREISEVLLHDVQGVVNRWGAEKIIVENDHGWNQHELLAACLPQVISQIVETTGCGLLLDLSHARLAAQRLGRDAASLLAELPLGHTQEIHITGIQYLPDNVLAKLRINGVPESKIQQYHDRPLDHLPLTPADWPWMNWLATAYQQGRLGAPWLTVLECGGVGSLWQALTDQQALAEQIPPLYRMFAG